MNRVKERERERCKPLLRHIETKAHTQCKFGRQAGWQALFSSSLLQPNFWLIGSEFSVSF